MASSNNSNFSCYVKIINTTAYAMNLQGTPYAGSYDNYTVSPASQIPAMSDGVPGSTTFMIASDNSSAGTDGYCSYQFANSQNVLTFSYACPYIDVNSFLVTVNINGVTGPVGEGICQVIPNPLPQYGRPVYLQFTLLNTI